VSVAGERCANLMRHTDIRICSQNGQRTSLWELRGGFLHEWSGSGNELGRRDEIRPENSFLRRAHQHDIRFEMSADQRELLELRHQP